MKVPSVRDDTEALGICASLRRSASEKESGFLIQENRDNPKSIRQKRMTVICCFFLFIATSLKTKIQKRIKRSVNQKCCSHQQHHCGIYHLSHIKNLSACNMILR